VLFGPGKPFATLSKQSLERQAKRFAQKLQSLLNGTIASSANFAATIDLDGSLGWVVNQPFKQKPWSGKPVALTTSPGRRPLCYLQVLQTLILDPEGSHLTTKRATFGLYRDAAAEELLFHYDYEREPGNPYPAAHFQVAGTSTAFSGVMKAVGLTKQLKDLHFPVGGKRFRPSLEDIIEFLVTERLVDKHPRWASVLRTSREEFHKIQLAAAVRRDPDTALEELENLGLVE
jgi:hypothetical protein